MGPMEAGITAAGITAAGTTTAGGTAPGGGTITTVVGIVSIGSGTRDIRVLGILGFTILV
jgi:hypothetical protein